MRRRSERKKSADISPPAPATRRNSRRSKKSPSLPEVHNVDISAQIENPVIWIEKTSESTSDCPREVHEEEIKTENKNLFSISLQLLKDSDQSLKCSGLEKKKNTNDLISIKCENILQSNLNIDTNPVTDVIFSEFQPLNTKLLNNCELAGEKSKLTEDIETSDIKLNTSALKEPKNTLSDINYINTKNEYTSNVNLKDSITQIESDAFPLKQENNIYINLSSDVSKIRKRKWISKKQPESLFPILSISTDSLKNLVSDVQPVPLCDIKLDSSSEVEEFGTDKDVSNENSQEDNIDVFGVIEQHQTDKDKLGANRNCSNNERLGALTCVALRSPPSLSKNETSDVLYISNLVRPFTVLQLKGLLARTGKIIDNGFWIDRIKSRCYVQYETSDEAIETRHALHGIRWPASNPKCLNVDFGEKGNMMKAILSTQDDNINGQDSTKENCNIKMSLCRDDLKIRPVREWDVGKNNNSDAEKRRDMEKIYSVRQQDRDIMKNREAAKNDKKHRKENKLRSNSTSPGRKHQRKDNEPPLRLLDDLFRKTQTTPCIYWLPLTPEQIAEKEIIRKKRFDEQQLRMQEREIEKEKAYEREKERNREKNRIREKDLRLDRSNDRRKSRSRDRRRY